MEKKRKSVGFKADTHCRKLKINATAVSMRPGSWMPVSLCVCLAFSVRAQCDKMKNLGMPVLINGGLGLAEKCTSNTEAVST